MKPLIKQIDAYVECLQARNLSTRTIKLYLSYLKTLSEFIKSLGRKNGAQVTPDDLMQWQVMLYRKGLSAGLRRQQTALIKRFFQWLETHGEILTSPARDLESPKTGDPLPDIPPSAERIQEILDGLPKSTPDEIRNWAFLELLYGSLLRNSEAQRLKIQDIDLAEVTLTVRKGKGAKDRVIPLTSKSLEALQDYLAVRHCFLVKEERDELFLTRKGTPFGRGSVSGLFKSLRRKIGMKTFYPHLLRHAGAVHLLKGGLGLRLVQEILGHERLDTTKVYLRLVSSDLKGVYDNAFPEVII